MELTLHMSLMRSMTLDPHTCTDTLAARCRVGDVDRETSIHGLCLPLGWAPSTGMESVLDSNIGDCAGSKRPARM